MKPRIMPGIALAKDRRADEPGINKSRKFHKM
jgi:hypothetical protein